MDNYTGMVVKTTAGHDKGGLFLVVKSDEKYLYLANGKQRKLTNPKRKNRGQVSEMVITVMEPPHSDKELRGILASIKEGITFGKR
ncbi:MAG: KOW domain-containing RNA-binding protein [Eubacteriales bacterium]